MSGYVYFIRCHDRVKIGFSLDVHKRLASLQTGAPYPCELLGSVSADDFPEGDLHQRFAEYRVHGEWFLAVPAILDFVATVTTIEAKPDRWSRVDLTGASPFKVWRYANKVTATEAAAQCGVTHGAWSQWENGIASVAPERVLQVERVTGISRHALRPDIFGETA